MFNLDALDQLIAVVVVLLVLSLIVQSIQTAIKKFFRIKSLQFEQSLIHLFYYLLDKDALKAMQTASDRMPLFRALLKLPVIRSLVPQEAISLSSRDPQVAAFYQAVKEEFLRAGRVSPRGKLLIESLSKDELIKFIGRVRVNDLIQYIPIPDHGDLSELNERIAAARSSIQQFYIKHHALIENTPLGEIRQPVLELLSNAHIFLDLKNSDLTLCDLGVSVVGAARKTLEALPDSIEESILRLKDDAQTETAQALQKLQKSLAPVSEEMRAIIALPRRLSQLPEKVELWYDTIMRSFEERYNRSMKTFALAISFIVVALLNANIFGIYRQISTDKNKRDLIAQSGDQIVNKLREQQAAGQSASQAAITFDQWKTESFKQIEEDASLYTALGFTGPRWIVDAWKAPQRPKANQILETVVGWLVMTMLLSVGAPFWQDALESLFGLKNLLRRRSAPGAGSQDSGQ
jgi:hypothetical protein